MPRRKLSVFLCAFGVSILATPVLMAQRIDDGTVSILLISSGNLDEPTTTDKPTTSILESDVKPLTIAKPLAQDVSKLDVSKLDVSSQDRSSKSDSSVDPHDGELVQQLYANGSPRISKHVKLDANGNYVNHGEYQEFGPTGDLVVSGEYRMGQQHGLWIRICATKQSKLFESEPYAKFKAPFQSTAEFAEGKLNGVWSISDKDGKKVSEIQFASGQRNGLATWFHPNGTVFWQSEYKAGKLNGAFIEKDVSGKITRQNKFVDGHRLAKSTEHYASKKIKVEFDVLSPAQVLVSPDDWNTSTLATYDPKGDEIKHGSYTYYYETGAVRSKSNYKNGLQDGEFAAWYSNNQREVVGSYVDGKQHGKWSWWHENGMRKAIANYEHGQLTEPAMAWNDQGVRVEASELIESKPAPVPQSEEPKSSRSASTSRRPGKK